MTAEEEPSEVGTPSDAHAESTQVVDPVAEDMPLGLDHAEPVNIRRDASSADSPQLVVLRGRRADERFFLAPGRSTVGRLSTSTIVLDDVAVSREHAEFRRGSAGVTVADLGSLNGTYVNRAPIEEPTALRDGDEIWIGTTRMRFVSGARPPGDPTADRSR